MSVIQRLLPPQTSRISRRILDNSDTRNIQIDKIVLLGPPGERWQVDSTWSAGGCKTRNVSLQCFGDRFADYAWVGATKEGIADVLPMKRWWNAKLIGVGIVLESSIKVVGVTSEF